jgi:ribulose-5-phosphate 4-epimerase/fuculose-1-phosphate aldolase
MQPAGLNRGTAGNVSVRSGDGFLHHADRHALRQPDTPMTSR